MKKKTKKKIVKSLIVIIVIGIIFYFGFLNNEFNRGKGNMENAKYKKILLIGIDGMDFKITNQLMKEGKLPNIQKLMEQGSLHSLATSLPPHSPVAWTTIATGKNPGKHNIFDFIRVDRERQIPELSLAKSKSGIGGTNYESYVKADPFWRVTSNNGIPTTVIRWPLSFPPEKIEGKSLGGLGIPDIKGLLADYTIYTTLTADDFKEAKHVIEVEDLGDVIKTSISGPRTRKGGDIINIKVPLRIDIVNGNSVILKIQDKEYPIQVGGWSDWIRVKFKVGMLKNVYGICKAYLASVEPEFQMYLTDVQIDPENPVVEISYPNDYSKDLANKIGLYNTLGIPEDTGALVDESITDEVFLEQVRQIENERDRMFWYEFEKFRNSKYGIFAFVYDSSDRIQHTFWEHKILGKDNKEDKIKLNPMVIRYFEEKDKFIEKVLDQIGNDTAVIILSDHGFASFERNVDINAWLVKNGYMTLTQEPSEDKNGELFEYVDWSKTKAYSLGFNSLYINLKGRESKGIVDESERKILVKEIAEKLEKLEDPEFGTNVVYRAYPREEVYKGNYVEEAPDLMIGFYPGYRMSWQTAVGGVTPEVIFDNTKKWDGDHLIDPSFVPGILLTNFKINKDNPNLMDVAPTILSLFGQKIPEDMDGESLV